jgi:hypothetical protein
MLFGHADPARLLRCDVTSQRIKAWRAPMRRRPGLPQIAN